MDRLTPPTPAELAAWQAATDAATPGPWTYTSEFCDCGGDYPCGHGSYPIQVETMAKAFERYPRLEPQKLYPGVIADFIEADQATVADAKFIALTRAAMPRLLAEVARLRVELRRIQGENTAKHMRRDRDTALTGTADPAPDEADRLRAEQESTAKILEIAANASHYAELGGSPDGVAVYMGWIIDAYRAMNRAEPDEAAL